MADSGGPARKSYKAEHISNSQVLQGDHSSINVHGLSPNQNAQLGALFGALDDQIADTALTASERTDATKQAGELEAAVTQQGTPDVGRMRKVLTWFNDHVPALAGAVLSIVVNPIVGQLVRAGGDLLVQEFKEHFGEDPGK
ncbi:hypothetical protein ACQPYH_28165 [Kribbella sp. CA-245084]|uniref:hypothetical protein n=1 Tax=Kribbella sp. CA-245084 TaxID=3239940 RepID=UPI003D913FEA